MRRQNSRADSLRPSFSNSESQRCETTMADLNRFVWWAFSFLCHQIPERRRTFLACSSVMLRCTGIVVGSAILIILPSQSRRMQGCLSLALALLLRLMYLQPWQAFGPWITAYVCYRGLWGFFGIAAVLVLFEFANRHTKDWYVKKISEVGPARQSRQAGKF